MHVGCNCRVEKVSKFNEIFKRLCYNLSINFILGTEMAQKNGFIYRKAMGREDNPEFREARLPGKRWHIFKDLVKNKLGMLFKVNLLIVLFMLPAFAWIYYNSLDITVQDSYISYSGNVGFGFPAVSDAVALGQYVRMVINIRTFLWLIPLLVIAGIGLAGGFHAMKLIVWGETIKPIRTFFKGIKGKNTVIFMITTLVLSIGIALIGIIISYYQAWEAGAFLKVMSLILSILLLVFLIFMACYIFTQTVTYKLKLKALLKNSLLFSGGMMMPNFFFILVCTAGPIVLMLTVPFISVILVAFYAMIGISFIVLIWTLIAQGAFDRFINVPISASSVRIKYNMTTEQKSQSRKEAEERRKKNTSVNYKNPKKKNSSNASKPKDKKS